MTALEKAVSIPDDVLVRIVDGEAVLLNLKTEFYFGLDGPSTEFWHAIDASDTLEGAVQALLEVFDVDEDRLRVDFTAFVDDLVESELLHYDEAASQAP